MKNPWRALVFAILSVPLSARAETYLSTSEFLASIAGPTVINFEGLAPAGSFVFLGNPGQFNQAGLAIANNSNMFVQNNNLYGTGAFLSPQGATPQVVTFTLPAGTKAIGFSYQSAAATVQIDGGPAVSIPAVAFGSLGFFGVTSSASLTSVRITIAGPGMDIDNVILASVTVQPASVARVPSGAASQLIFNFDLTAQQLPVPPFAAIKFTAQYAASDPVVGSDLLAYTLYGDAGGVNSLSSPAFPAASYQNSGTTLTAFTANPVFSPMLDGVFSIGVYAIAGAADLISLCAQGDLVTNSTLPVICTPVSSGVLINPPLTGAFNIANLTYAATFVRDCTQGACGPGGITAPAVQRIESTLLGGPQSSATATHALGVVGANATAAASQTDAISLGAFSNSTSRVNAGGATLQQYTYTGATPLIVTGTASLSYSQLGTNIAPAVFDVDPLAVGSGLVAKVTIFRYTPGLIPVDTRAVAAPGRCALAVDSGTAAILDLVTCLQTLPSYRLLQAIDVISDGSGSQSFALNFSLQPGEKFYVLGTGQALARLGGQLDARNTFQVTFDNSSLFVATPATVEVAGVDTDGDGVSDNRDACPATAPGTTVNESGCPLPPPDSDADGVPDSVDACPNTPPGAAVDAAGCAASQRDADHDGVSDAVDLCPNTTTNAAVNANGCSAAQLDADLDGVSNAADLCPNTAPGSAVDANGCSAAQRDTDHDGVAESIDVCPGTPANTPVDAVGCPITQQSRTCDVDRDRDVDRLDIAAILQSLGKRATGASDPRDANHNGKVDIFDAAICVSRCDRRLCATN